MAAGLPRSVNGKHVMWGAGQGYPATDQVSANNLIYHGNSNGISIGGYDSKRGGTDHCTIVNNTLYDNDVQQTGSGEFQVQYYATNNVFKDNIVYAGASQDLFFNNYTHSESNPVDVDYNLYYSTDAANGMASRAGKFFAAKNFFPARWVAVRGRFCGEVLHFFR